MSRLRDKNTNGKGYHMMAFKKLTDEQKRECYKSYCEDLRHECGDRVKPMPYEEWCKVFEQIDEILMSN